MTTIKLKNGSGAPTAGDLAQGEPALDLTNKRLYTEDSGGTVIEVGTNPGVDVTFADNRKAVFGADSDLQIYHDGSNSYVTDAGTGDLRIRGANVEIQTGSGNKYFQGAANVASLYHTNNLKLATTATGIDVTGTAVTDGLTMASGSQATIGVFGTSGLQLIGTTGGDNVVGTMGASEPLIFRTVSAERMRIDSSGNVGIGTSSPSDLMTIQSPASGGGNGITIKRNDNGTDQRVGAISFGNTVDSDLAQITVQTSSGNNGDGNLLFHTQPNGGSTTERMRIDSSGQVGIGTSSPTNPLTVVGTGGSTFIASKGVVVDYQSSSVSDIVPIGFSWSSSTATQNPYWGMAFIPTNYSSAVGDLGFYVGNSERMRIDSSGNVLVGKTSADNTTQGVRIYSTGRQSIVSEADTALIVNRRTSDGTIIDLRKDGTAVGQINARSGDLVIGTGTTGLQFYDVGNAIFPLSASGNTNRDAAIDLGEASNRFKDLYLSGNITHGTTPSSSAAGVISEAVGRATYSRGSGTGGFAHLTFINGNGTVGTVVTSGSATAYNTSSDYRLKENVVSMTGATARLKQLAPKRFNFIADSDTTVDGFLAHEVADVVPEAVTGAKDAVDDEGNAVYQGIDQSKLVPLLVATIQELEARIAALESN